jgi:hypothetical protein
MEKEYSIVHPNTNAVFIQRVQNLSSESKPLWGTMNAAQMLTHCKIVLQSALGEVQLKRVWIGLLIGQRFKKIILGATGFGKNIPTLKEAKIKDEHVFEVEQQNVIKLLERFASGGEQILRTRVHPFFGKMSPEEWDVFEAKHLDHHLRQFGV